MSIFPDMFGLPAAGLAAGTGKSSVNPFLKFKPG
jgi:hypothetical protein